MSDGVVSFNYNEFIGYYPEFANVPQNIAQWQFDLACLILANTPCSAVRDLEERKMLLYLLTAHILFLRNRGSGSVGAISNASEGSVSVGYASLGKLGQTYFGQTQYGLLFWQMVVKYMSGFYVPEC